jgi:multiple sugar transport system substrate-binding protein
MRRLALTVLVLALAGCGSDDGGGGGAGDPITFQVTGDPEETRVYRELADVYRQETGRRVNVVEVPERDVHLARLTTTLAAGRPPDVFLINHRNVGGFAARGAIDPAGPRMESSSAFSEDDFYPLPLAAFEWEGTLQCVPQNASSLVVYYNADAFREAGLDPPRGTWTYKEFASAAEQLTGDGRHGVGIDVSVIRTAPWVWGAGGELVDDEDRPQRFTLDTPEARRGLENLLALHSEGWAPTADEAAAQPVDERFLDGSLAMLLSSRRDVPLMRTITDFEWDVAPFPTAAEPASVLHSDGFCASKAGNTEAAWQWIEFALGTRGQEILAASGRSVPSLRAVAESPAFLDPGDPPASSQVFLDALEHMHRLPTTENWTAVEQRADDILMQLYYGNLGMDEALERLGRETDGQF